MRRRISEGKENGFECPLLKKKSRLLVLISLERRDDLKTITEEKKRKGVRSNWKSMEKNPCTAGSNRNKSGHANLDRGKEWLQHLSLLR